MSEDMTKIINVGACIAAVGVTTNAIKRMKNEPNNKMPYTMASTALWLYCIRTSAAILNL